MVVASTADARVQGASFSINLVNKFRIGNGSEIYVAATRQSGSDWPTRH
jgi:hypothetical protein